MTSKRIICPQCGSDQLQRGELRIRRSVMQISFATGLFGRKPVSAYVCEECGYLFLFLATAVGSEERAA